MLNDSESYFTSSTSATYNSFLRIVFASKGICNDVYLQECSAFDHGNSFCNNARLVYGKVPVSYTHLDVYKRQA